MRKASVERLRSVPILERLATPQLEVISRQFLTEHYAEDRLIVHEGDRGDRFYVIVRGKVAVSKLVPDGKSRRVATLSDGDFFGEIALLKNVPRTATVRALTPCLLMSLCRDAFKALVANEPELQAILEKALTERLTVPAAASGERIDDG